MPPITPPQPQGAVVNPAPEDAAPPAPPAPTPPTKEPKVDEAKPAEPEPTDIQAKVVIAGGGLERGRVITVKSNDHRLGRSLVAVEAPAPSPEEKAGDEAFQDLKGSVGSDDGPSN